MMEVFAGETNDNGCKRQLADAEAERDKIFENHIDVSFEEFSIMKEGLDLWLRLRDEKGGKRVFECF